MVSTSGAEASAELLPPLTSLSYSAPTIPVILTLASFLLLLSLSSRLFSRLLPGSAPVLGPLLCGLIYGAPLASILPADVQRSVQSIGYLGLLLLLVEGGGETRLDILSDFKNAALALVVGLTGIALPIVLCVVLLPPAFGYGCVESFAIGAALSSTSLGTVFAVIQTLAGDDRSRRSEAKTSSNGDKRDAGDLAGNTGMRTSAVDTDLINTRAGTILIGAALLDDIIGLVLASVVVALPPDNSSSAPGASTNIAPWPLARPVVSSVLILLITALLCRWILRPLIDKQSARLCQSFNTASNLLARTAQ
ncbi:hypothetical protein V8E36_007023 [Tilletia maclaganii]